MLEDVPLQNEVNVFTMTFAEYPNGQYSSGTLSYRFQHDDGTVTEDSIQMRPKHSEGTADVASWILRSVESALDEL